MSESRSLEQEIEFLKGELATATWAFGAIFGLLSTIGDTKLNSFIVSKIEGLATGGENDVIPPSGMPDSRWGFPSGPISDSMW